MNSTNERLMNEIDFKFTVGCSHGKEHPIDCVKCILETLDLISEIKQDK